MNYCTFHDIRMNDHKLQAKCLVLKKFTIHFELFVVGWVVGVLFERTAQVEMLICLHKYYNISIYHA